MKAYHGTNAIFSEFDSGFCSKASGCEQYGSGFYFTNNEGTARLYGKYIYETELNIKKPYVLEIGDTTNDIFLSAFAVKKIILQHPHIYEPCDSEDFMNPLGDYSERFWQDCKADNPNLKKNIKQIVGEVVQDYFCNPTLLNVDMFYETSGVVKQAFLDAVTKTLGYDGVISRGIHSNIIVAWHSDQIDIQKINGLEKENKKHKHANMER